VDQRLHKKDEMKNNLEKRIKEDNFWATEYLDAINNNLVNNHKIENAFWRESIKRGRFASLSQQYPKAVEHWVRFSRIFKDSLWNEIRPVCERHLANLVHDCETVALIRQKAEDRINQHKCLLERVSAETLLIHFADWLEDKYSEASDDFTFYNNIINYRNVLQECLIRVSKADACTIYEITQRITKYSSRGANRSKSENPPFHLFEALFQRLKADFNEEMFCSQGWSIYDQNDDVYAVPSSEQHIAIGLSKQKTYICDFIEFEMLSGDLEMDCKCRSLFREAPTEFLAQFVLFFRTGQRFLERCFGKELLQTENNHLGVNPIKMMQVFLATVVYCKQELYGSSEKNGDIGLSPIEVLTFSQISEITNIILAHSIPETEMKIIFEKFSADIHDRKAIEIALENNCMLLKNRYCYLFLPRLFFDSKYVIQGLFNTIFTNNKKASAKYMENRVKFLSECQKFQTITGYPLKADGKDKGEIDVLAFRDNTLFIIEAKMTYQRILVNDIRSLRATYDGAGEQLDNILDLLPEYWADISKKLRISVPYTSVKKVTLIVTNSCEYDHHYFQGHLKISLCELETVLVMSNSSMLFALHEEMRSFGYQYDPASSTDILNQYRLFPSENPSVDQIIACLEESRFWELVLDEKIEPTPLFSVPPVDSPKEI
jgi:hypothetical protein